MQPEKNWFSWGIIIVLAIVFWPFAIVYMIAKAADRIAKS